MSSNVVIETAGLTRLFGDLPAVQDLTLSIRRGEVFGFLGPNGSGKTTTIRMLLGLIRPTRGDATVLGCDVRAASHCIRERTGALLEEDGLYERLSAQANLDYFARIYHLDRKWRDKRIHELLGTMGLADRGASSKDEQVGRWSKGMKRRLAMARALIHDPELVFLDEPLSGLDPAGARDLRAVIRRMAEEGRTVFLTTHNLGEAERLCSRVGVIHRGRLVALGTSDEIRGRMSRPTVCIGAENVDPRVVDEIRAMSFVGTVRMEDGQLVVELDHLRRAGDLVRRLVESGAEVWKAAPQERSLEEVFLELVADEKKT